MKDDYTHGSATLGSNTGPQTALSAQQFTRRAAQPGKRHVSARPYRVTELAAGPAGSCCRKPWEGNVAAGTGSRKTPVSCDKGRRQRVAHACFQLRVTVVQSRPELGHPEQIGAGQDAPLMRGGGRLVQGFVDLCQRGGKTSWIGARLAMEFGKKGLADAGLVHTRFKSLRGRVVEPHNLSRQQAPLRRRGSMLR